MHKPVILSFSVLLFLVVGVYASGAGAQERLVVNTGFTPPVSTFFHLVVDEAGRRLDIPVDFQEMPAERSLVLVSAGVDDAECCRIPTVIQQDNPDLMSVPFSFFTARFSAFTRDKTITIKNWQDLQPYTVGVVTGWKILVQNVAKVQPKGYVVLDTPEAMFQMLEQGRIDIATLGYLSGLQVLL